MQSAYEAAKLAVLRAHPDLAGKAKLTDDSTREQAGAGLNTLTPDEFDRFTQLNDAYKAKFRTALSNIRMPISSMPGTMQTVSWFPRTP